MSNGVRHCSVRLFFKEGILLLHVHFTVQGFHLCFAHKVFLSVVDFKDETLCGGDELEGAVDEPGAFVVLDVRADLANVFGVTVAV